MKRTLCISIDLDPLRCYREIYGLPSVIDRLDPVMLTASARFVDLLDELGAKGSLFVVGDSLQEAAAADRIRAVAEAGHEIANHSWSHAYDLSRLETPAIAEQIQRGAEAITRVTGRAPVGFRAPGYLLGSRMLAEVARAGMLYDSSVLPSPAYQLAKAAALAYLHLRGRPSRSVIGDPRESLAKALPYRPDVHKPWRGVRIAGAGPLVELPISRVGPAPLTGALLTLAGPTASAGFARWLARKAFVNLELHGVDLLDLSTDSLDPALAAQADLRIHWEKKRAAILAFCARLRVTHTIETLESAAGTF